MFRNCEKTKFLYEKYTSLLTHGQDVLLLVIRLYWGWSFFRTGLGKFQNFDKVVGFFTSLGIPLPEVNVVMAAGTEMIGGLLLLAGLGSRVVTVPLIFTMCVAYATAHTTELSMIFSEPDKFTGAPPFLFLYASVLVLLFGPGKYALDSMWGRCCKGKCSRTDSNA
ncbi:MAG: DoxX family protein [Bdellovibrionales bacterium]|nr:DoxX family protein [Bdellovibrionales bacterium]